MVMKYTKKSSKDERCPTRRLKPHFPYCTSVRLLSVSDLTTVPHCGQKDCSLPHLTLHDIAERVADARLHFTRNSRRNAKSANREKRKKIAEQSVGSNHE
ncbi:hypothetical protein PINS_up008744 [Pythium insidiosum]|nr:hypothetical protein PINS_up008744 [Pythium insidiosum]